MSSNVCQLQYHVLVHLSFTKLCLYFALDSCLFEYSICTWTVLEMQRILNIPMFCYQLVQKIISTNKQSLHEQKSSCYFVCSLQQFAHYSIWKFLFVLILHRKLFNFCSANSIEQVIHAFKLKVMYIFSQMRNLFQLSMSSLFLMRNFIPDTFWVYLVHIAADSTLL